MQRLSKWLLVAVVVIALAVIVVPMAARQIRRTTGAACRAQMEEYVAGVRSKMSSECR